MCEKLPAYWRSLLVEAIGAALSAVSAQDARGYFEHAGYLHQLTYCETCCHMCCSIICCIILSVSKRRCSIQSIP
jgi:hypothetical protein